MTGTPGRRGLDAGRLVLVPIVVLLLVGNVYRAAEGFAGAADSGTLTAVLESLAIVLACAFYTLVLAAYLRRGRARATSRRLSAHAVAALATVLPFSLPLLGDADTGAAALVLADLLVLGGVAFSVWSIRHLSGSFSILAQARAVVATGPYRWVRHPLYTGEVLAALGLAVHAGSWAALAAWVALPLMQGYRAVQEEEILVSSLPDYRTYQRSTARLVPRLF